MWDNNVLTARYCSGWSGRVRLLKEQPSSSSHHHAVSAVNSSLLCRHRDVKNSRPKSLMSLCSLCIPEPSRRKHLCADRAPELDIFTVLTPGFGRQGRQGERQKRWKRAQLFWLKSFFFPPQTFRLTPLPVHASCDGKCWWCVCVVLLSQAVRGLRWAHRWLKGSSRSSRCLFTQLFNMSVLQIFSNLMPRHIRSSL